MTDLVFTPGDVSGNETLTSDDGLYQSHINEVRTILQDHENRIGVTQLFDVKKYGAVGDGVTDDSAAIELARLAAIADNSYAILYFPAGHYYMGSYTIDFDAKLIGVRGENWSNVWLMTDQNVPMIRMNAIVDYYNREISDLTFIGSVSGTRSSNDAILIEGATSNYVNYCDFKNLHFQGVYMGIHSTKSTNVGGENHFNFCKFLNISLQNQGANAVEYGIKFDYGSGTGNIFDQISGGAVTSIIEMGGAGDVNVGDLIFTNIQTAVAQNGIKLTKGATAYGSNIVVTACQFDAGTVNGINFTNMNGFRVSQINAGQQVNMLTPGCSNFHIEYLDTQSTYQYQHTGVGVGATRNLFQLTLPAYVAFMLEVTTYGFIQGKGQCITTTRYHVYSNEIPNSSVTEIDTTITGPGTITHSTSTSGGDVTFKAAINSTIAGSNLCTVIRIIGGGISAGYQISLL